MITDFVKADEDAHHLLSCQVDQSAHLWKEMLSWKLYCPRLLATWQYLNWDCLQTKGLGNIWQAVFWKQKSAESDRRSPVYGPVRKQSDTVSFGTRSFWGDRHGHQSKEHTFCCLFVMSSGKQDFFLCK